MIPADRFRDHACGSIDLSERAGHKVRFHAATGAATGGFWIWRITPNIFSSKDSRTEADFRKALGGGRRYSRPNLPERLSGLRASIFSHLQWTLHGASMVVWEKRRMKKSDYRKFIIRGDEAPEEGASAERRFCPHDEAVVGDTGGLQEEKSIAGTNPIDADGAGARGGRALESLQTASCRCPALRRDKILYGLGPRKMSPPGNSTGNSPVLNLSQLGVAMRRTAYVCLAFIVSGAGPDRLTPRCWIPVYRPRLPSRLLQRYGAWPSE